MSSDWAPMRRPLARADDARMELVSRAPTTRPPLKLHQINQLNSSPYHTGIHWLYRFQIHHSAPHHGSEPWITTALHRSCFTDQHDLAYNSVPDKPFTWTPGPSIEELLTSEEFLLASSGELPAAQIEENRVSESSLLPSEKSPLTLITSMAPPQRPSCGANSILPSTEKYVEESFSAQEILLQTSSAQVSSTRGSSTRNSSAQGFHDSDTCSLSGCRNPLECSSPKCCKDADCVEFVDSESFFASTDQDADFFPSERQKTLSCQWVLPGRTCTVSPNSLQDLGNHIIHDHIEPQTQQRCQWDHCNDVVDPGELVNHLSHNHHPDSYVCLWKGCETTNFSSSDALDQHFKLVHTKTIDCRWGGCGVAGHNFGVVKNHVYNEHLNISLDQAQRHPGHFSYSSSSYDTNFFPNQPTPVASFASSQTPSDQPNAYSGLSTYTTSPDCSGRTSRQPTLDFSNDSSTMSMDRPSQYPGSLPYSSTSSDSSTSPQQPTQVALTTSSKNTAGLPFQYHFAQPSMESFNVSSVNPRKQTSDISTIPMGLTKESSKDQTEAPEAPDATRLHICVWRLDRGQGPMPCGHVLIGTENDLQAHVEAEHTLKRSALADGRGDGWVCKWRECPREDKKSFRDRCSLNRHIYSHTGCM